MPDEKTNEESTEEKAVEKAADEGKVEGGEQVPAEGTESGGGQGEEVGKAA